MMAPTLAPLVVRCPAKINRFLAVGPKDAAGYHPLRTEFWSIGLYDDLLLEAAEADEFVCNVDLPEKNTVTRAWSLLREVAPLPAMRVTLTKRIPSEAGLGGGSSDAAGLFRGVQAWLGLTIPPGELASLALAVGADVPFFLVGGRARAEGYGERLTALADAEPIWLVVAKPEVGCATRPMYAALDALSFEWRGWPADGEPPYNDFERVAPSECLDLADRLRRLGAEAAALSGSGSAVFGEFGNEEAARRAASGLQESNWVVRSLTRSESLASFAG